MGGFYDSIHVRTESYDLVKSVLAELAKKDGHKFYLAPPINGWVSLFPEKYGDETLALAISRQTKMNVLRLMVHDDDVFCYFYYCEGKLVDEYNSRPDYFGDKVPAKERKRLKGNPEVFSDLVNDEAKMAKIRKILKPRSLLKKMQIPDELKEMNKKMKSLAKEVHHFANDQSAINEYLKQNPDLLKEDYSSMAELVKKEGITSPEDMLKFMENNGKAQEMAMKIMESFWKSRLDSKEFEFFNPNSDEAKKLSVAMDQFYNQFGANNKNIGKMAEVVFASEPMRQFAEILGVPNALTSYEYLKAGETDDIKEWDKFIEIA
jgi:hypothetical protein